MLLFKNKKGGEKVLSIWWFFVLVFIFAGIIGGVLLYYSTDVDIRDLEADVLSEKILSCFNYNFEISGEANFNIYEKCGLNKELFSSESIFYFSIDIKDEAGNSILKQGKISGGKVSFEGDCKAVSSNEQIRARNYPKCVPKTEKIWFIQNGIVKQGEIEILAASNQAGKKLAVI